MAGVSVVFKAVDDISSRFDTMTAAGTKALDSFDRMETAADSSYGAISGGAAEAAEAIDRAAESAGNLAEAVSGNMEEAGEALEGAAQGMEELGEKSDKAGDAINRFLPKDRELGEEIDKTRKEQEKYREETEKTTDSVEKLGTMLATVGIAATLTSIAGAIMDCSAAAAQFETNVAMVSTVADTAVLSAGELSSQISALSMDTARNVNELADASYNAISAGVDTANSVATVGEASKLATAGFTSSSSALSVLTTTLNAYGLEASEVTNISDSLVTSQNLGVLTIDQLASSMGKAISTASAYSVDLYNLESGYISLTKAGISVEESTTYISSMFNELGSASSEVSAIIAEETGKSFGQLMNDGYSLADVLDIIYESAGRDGEALMNLWGSAEAGKAANAIINQGLETFNANLEKLGNSSGTTQAAYEAMTNTTEFANQRMANSFANLQIAIGDDLNPVMAALYNGVADITDGFTRLIWDTPQVTAALTGVTVAVAAGTAIITGYKVAVVAAEMATKAWAMAMDLNPVFITITAVAALTAGIAAYAMMLDDAESEYDTWTEATKRQYDELQSLNTEYEEAVSVYGETSEEALRLRYQIDDLSDSFEANKKTLEGLLDKSAGLVSSFEESKQAYQENADALGDSEVQTLALIRKLEDLASSTERTAGSEDVMRLIIDQLNGSVSGLNMTYEELMSNQDAAVDAMVKAAEAQAEQERQMSYYERYVELTKQHGDAEAVRADLIEEQLAKQERYNQLLDEFNAMKAAALENDPSGRGTAGLFQTDVYNDMLSAQKDLEEVDAAVEELTASIEDQEAEMESLEASWRRVAEEAEAAMEHEVTAEEAVSVAVESVAEEIEELAQAYDDAYNAAKASIDGQIGLFDTMKTESEQSVADMQAALESQMEYLGLYTENLQKASEYGLESGLISSLSDGSAESAGQLDAIISKIEELGGSTEGMSREAQDFVESFNQSFSQVEEAKDIWSETVAQMETDFSDGMDGIRSEMESAVEHMDMSDEAAAAAAATMDAYIQAIKGKTGEVNSALAAVSMANAGTAGLHGYASGTFDAAPGLALVGEEGPELVNFGGGEVVYTADETADILARGKEDGGKEFFIPPLGEEESGDGSGDRTITLRIEGAGELKVGGGTSKEDILDVIVENAKGVLFDILQQEIMEEGEGSYEF